MRAGQLRHQLEFRTYTTSVDSMGAHSKTWSTTGTILWGEVRPWRPTESPDAEKLEGVTSHKIKVRYDPVLTNFDEKYRIHMVGTNRVFEITAPPVKPMERNIFFEIACKEYD